MPQPFPDRPSRRWVYPTDAPVQNAMQLRRWIQSTRGRMLWVEFFTPTRQRLEWLAAAQRRHADSGMMALAVCVAPPDQWADPVRPMLVKAGGDFPAAMLAGGDMAAVAAPWVIADLAPADLPWGLLIGWSGDVLATAPAGASATELDRLVAAACAGALPTTQPVRRRGLEAVAELIDTKAGVIVATVVTVTPDLTTGVAALADRLADKLAAAADGSPDILKTRPTAVLGFREVSAEATRAADGAALARRLHARLTGKPGWRMIDAKTTAAAMKRHDLTLLTVSYDPVVLIDKLPGRYAITGWVGRMTGKTE